MTHILAKLYLQDLIDAGHKYLYARADTDGVDDEEFKEALKDSIAEVVGDTAKGFVTFETLDTDTEPVVQSS